MKNDKQQFNPGSIRTRLTLFYTMAAFVVLSLVVLFFYWVTINILYKADYQFLSDEVDTIQYILGDEPADLAALRQAVIDIPLQPEGSIYHYHIRVFDDKKENMIETPGMSHILPAQKYYNKNSELLGKKRYFWYSHNGSNYLLIQSPILIGKKKTGLIQIALNISSQDFVIRDRKKILFMLLAGTLFALSIGFLIAHRGMRSLYVLTKTVQEITATSLHQRIDPKSWPKELGGLCHAFNQMLDRMEASFSRLKQFSADLSHELRTPITNMVGQTEVALSYANSVDEYKRVMESNLEEFDRVSSLIENILFLARAENPQIDLHKISLNVHEEIAFVCEFFEAMAEEKNIQVALEGKADLSANPIMFRRMISNLLSNALKYTPEGGWVKFTIKELDKNHVQIQLSDNGIGIAAHHLPKLFDRFYRIDTARSQQSGGTGLGLAIVKSIVDLHQGTISIHSEPDIGTTVCLSFLK